MWRFKAGARPNTITVFERDAGGMLYARAWDPSARNGKGNFVRVSLSHRDKARAKRYAVEQAAKLQTGDGALNRVTLAQVLGAYIEHRSPRKVATEQHADSRRAEMWIRVLGDIDPHTISMGKWQSFIDARTMGAIDARGNAVAQKERKAVRARTVEEDCDFLRQVLTWATKWRLPSGRYLMRENPVRGYDMPHENNPRRPFASQDRHEALRAISDKHMMETRQNRNGTRTMVRSYLSELLDIAKGTGRRISAICRLRFDDLCLERTREAPHGAIRWPAETDKMKRETAAPISPEVRVALDRILAERPAIGQVPLFPSARDSTKPITRYLAAAWLREAEKLANLPKQKGTLWHAYRRTWATERKPFPDADVAAAGGWKSVASLKLYQQPDAATMLAVVLGGGELREIKKG
jgi:integrase